MGDLEELNSECFTFENYEGNWWSLLDISWEKSMDKSVLRECIKKYAVGYCDSIRVKIRPRNGFAIMFEKDGERFWFHLENWEIN